MQGEGGQESSLSASESRQRALEALLAEAEKTSRSSGRAAVVWAAVSFLILIGATALILQVFILQQNKPQFAPPASDASFTNRQDIRRLDERLERVEDRLERLERDAASNIEGQGPATRDSVRDPSESGLEGSGESHSADHASGAPPSDSYNAQ